MLLLRSLLLTACVSLRSFTSAYIVTTEKWEPDLPLTPGRTLFYSVALEAKDTVVLVDVILANGILGNTSDVFADSDLRKKDDASAGFTVPVVPPGKQYTVRLVETSTKRFLADSPQFEIFGLNGVASSSPSTLPATTLPPLPKPTTNPAPSSDSSSSPLGPSSLSPSGASILLTNPLSSASKTTSNSSPLGTAPIDASSSSGAPDAAPHALVNDPKSKTPVGAVVGGVIGGLVVIGLIGFLLLRLRLRGFPNVNARGAENEKADGLALPGPHAVEPYTLPPSSSRQGTGFDSTVSSTGTEARSTGAGPFPSKQVYGFAETSSPTHASSSPAGSIPRSGPSTTLTRVEQLRLERERINRELAALEKRSGSGSNTIGSSAYGVSSHSLSSPAESRSTQDLLAEQLAMLQTQIRQLEERQHRRESDLPPMYDGPPASATSAFSPHIEPAPLAVSGDSKR